MADVLPLPRTAPVAIAPMDAAWLIGGVAALSLLALALFDPRLLGDGDTWWHLAAGGWMLDHGQVLHTDPFSFTRAGAPWQAHEWLSEVVMALAFRAGGWGGVTLLFGLTLAATALLLTRSLKRSLTGPGLILALVLALSCLGDNLLARPHLLVLPIVVAWTAEILAARAAGRPPRLWLSAGLLLVWANLHGSYVFAALVAGPLAIEALVEAPPAGRLKVARGWALVGAACIVAAALTPQGLEGLIFPFKLMTMSGLSGIAEWAPMDFTKPGAFELSLLATLFVCLTKGVRMAPLRVLMLLGLLFMTLTHSRHVLVLALVAPLLLAGPIRQALGPADPAVPSRRWTLGAAAIAVAALALVGLRQAVPLVRTDGPTSPITALDHVPDALRARPVLNEYGLGGYLIYRGVRPFIDGRTDLYGDDQVRRYFKLSSPDPVLLDQTLKQYGIAWAILPPAHPLAGLMAARPGWRRLYGDRYAVVFARADALTDSSR